jgi:integrase
MRRRDFGVIIPEGTATRPSFSVRWWDGPRQRRKRGFSTKGAAAEFLARKRIELADRPPEPGEPPPPEITVREAFNAYEEHLTEKGNKERSIKTTMHRLRAFFTADTMPLSMLTPKACAGTYAALRTASAVDTHRNTLAETKSFLRWCWKARRWIKANPLEEVEGTGKRRHGKAQLRIDEARTWMRKAVEFADAGEAGAVAAMTTLLLGMRAGEVVDRVVRDLDDDGHLLWIPASKTDAGRRTLRVPPMLRPYLLRLAANRPAAALLFGQHWRDWPREWVQKICRAAKVPEVTAHGMRGLHSTLAMEAGVTGAVVAASLGHESVTTTVTSYAKPEAVAAAQQDRALRVLEGGRKAVG